MKKISVLSLLSVVLFSFSAITHATPFGPQYPAPGGNTFSGNGVSGANGWAVWNLGGFDTNAFDTMYYGLNQVDYGPTGAGLNGNADVLNFSHISGNTAVWTGFTPWLASPGIVQAVQTRLLIAASCGNCWITDLASIGLDNTGAFGSLGAVLDVSSGANFGIEWTIQAFVNGGWQALNSVPQLASQDGKTRSSFATGFYWTESAVPEPSMLILLTAGLSGLMFRRRRIK